MSRTAPIASKLPARGRSRAKPAPFITEPMRLILGSYKNGTFASFLKLPYEQQFWLEVGRCGDPMIAFIMVELAKPGRENIDNAKIFMAKLSHGISSLNGLLYQSSSIALHERASFGS